MTQKVVIKVHMNDQKSRSKAMKIAVSVSGVQSAAVEGQDKTQIEVTGDGIDAAELTTLLRKKVGYADLVSVSSEKKEENPGEPNEQTKSEPVCLCSNAMPPRIYEVIYPNQYPYWDPNYNFFNMW